MRIIEDINYSIFNDDAHKITLYMPDSECHALLVYFHGGGFVEGNRSLDLLPHFAEDMTSVGIAVASAEYRMYPNAKYPDFIEDAAEAVAYAKEKLLPLTGTDKFFVSGTSAGAYQTLMLCFNSKWLGKYGITNQDITGFIHDAGQPPVHFNVLKERGGDPSDTIIDEAAPIYHVGKAPDYPPMQIIVSDNDLENRLEQTEMLIEKLKESSYDTSKLTYIITHGTHVWYVTANDSEGKNEFSKLILPFINKYI